MTRNSFYYNPPPALQEHPLHKGDFLLVITFSVILTKDASPRGRISPLFTKVLFKRQQVYSIPYYARFQRL